MQQRREQQYGRPNYSQDSQQGFSKRQASERSGRMNRDDYGRERYGREGYGVQGPNWSGNRPLNYASEGRYSHNEDTNSSRYGSNFSSSSNFDGTPNYLGDDQFRRDHQGENFRGEFSGKGPKGYKRADARIQEDVSDALTHDSHVDASEIEVSVKDGIVTLSGSVSERRMKRQAEDCAERISGVKDVRNELSTNAFGTSSETTEYGKSGTAGATGKNKSGSSSTNMM